jgi:hypothetical protein
MSFQASTFLTIFLNQSSSFTKIERFGKKQRETERYKEKCKVRDRKRNRGRERERHTNR